MASSNKLSRQQREKERAAAFFGFYKLMGPDRSLTKLLSQCTTIGLKTSENSLKRYSAKYQWQRRLMEEQAADQEKAEQDSSNIVAAMDEYQAKIGKAMQVMAEYGLQQKFEAIKNKEPFAFDFKDITSLYRTGQIGERLARGQATSREEIKVEIMNIVVERFALIFLAVNDIADPEIRKQEYIRRFNEGLRIDFPKGDKGK